MESEKVKEIKKALECCVDSIKYGCEGCPYHKSSSDCQELLIWNMQTYINELESENERLLESCKNCHYIKDLEIANGHAKELKDRISELEEENKSLYDSYHKGYKVGYEYGKQDAVSSDRAESDSQTSETTQTDYKLKQFAERLKEKIYENENSYIEFLSGKNAVAIDIVDFENCLDETLKEFIKQ